MIVVLAPKVLASLPIKAATPKLQIIDKLPPATRTLAYITQRLQPRTAFLAVIEELASIGRQTSAVSSSAPHMAGQPMQAARRFRT